MKTHRLLPPLLLACAVSCSPEESTYPEMMVVEGWIESGMPPVVMLTTSIAPSAEKQNFSDVSDHILRWAKVTVSDGTDEVILTGKPTTGHFPPYFYTTGRMLGQPGKTYTLTVDAGKYSCTASTTVPEPAELDSLEPIPYGDADGMWLIKATWRDNPHEKNVYKFFSKIHGVDSLYASARLNLIDDSLIEGGQAEAVISPSLHLERDNSHQGRFYSGEKVSVKFCTVDPACSDIMKDLDESVTQSVLPLFISNRNIQGNADGALGYFIGMGLTLYEVQIPPAEP